MPQERLRKSKKGLKESISDILSTITENPLMDWMYESPEESLMDVFGDKSSYSMTYPYSPYKHMDPTSMGNVEISKEGILDLFKQAGSPYVSLHDVSDEEFDWKYGGGEKPPRGAFALGEQDWAVNKNPKNLINKLFYKDAISISDFTGGGDGDFDTLIEELAHALTYADPETFTGHEDRSELYKKTLEDLEQYGKERHFKGGTEEWRAHMEISQMLRQWLAENYGVE